MPIHDLGYRAWKGQLTPQWLRWWVICQAGLKIAWKNFWVRRLLFVAWIPAFYFGAVFFMYEQWLAPRAEEMAAQAAARQGIAENAQNWMEGKSFDEMTEEERQALYQNAETVVEAEMQGYGRDQTTRVMRGLLPGLPLTLDRHAVWCWLMWMFFRHPQGLLMLMVVGLVAPSLVARDVGSRAFLLYFSRPINRVEYIVGKLAIVWCFVLMISTAPAIALYIFGVLLSPELSVIAYTWDVPLRILMASAVLLIPTTTLALALSSATTKSWVAGFAWFAVWIFGFVAYSILWAVVQSNAQFQVVTLDEKWSLMSIYHTLGNVQGWVFGIEGTITSVLPSVFLLLAVTVISLMVLFRRVSSPMRI